MVIWFTVLPPLGRRYRNNQHQTIIPTLGHYCNKTITIFHGVTRAMAISVRVKGAYVDATFLKTRSKWIC